MHSNRRSDIRNIAIIAHVDHGKTTLVDELLKQSGTFRDNQKIEERVMDSNDQEKERGITILAKNTSVKYGDYKINIVDTPGHADFSGEVERILTMVDGVCLLVDAFEGAMPQTKFVTRKALELGLKPIVVINKIDREGSRPNYVLNQVYDLFIELDANEEQLDFPVVYTSAKLGYALSNPDENSENQNFNFLFDTIIKHIPGPICHPNDPLQVLVTNLDYSDFLGRMGLGRILAGSVNQGQQVVYINHQNEIVKGKITKLFTHQGLQRIETLNATAGEIVIWAGTEKISIGDTLCDADKPNALPRLKIEEPTLIIHFIVNDSPFAGLEGQHVTSRKLRDRLFKEAETNVALRVEETDATDTFKVTGRGELHLSVLIENMRREGYEFQVSKPSVVFKNMESVVHEPFEELTIDVNEEFSGSVIEVLGKRKAEMIHMETYNKNTRMNFIIPARGLIGFRSMFMTLTRGYGSMSSIFHGFKPYKGEIQSRINGVLIALENTDTNAYAMYNLQDRGAMFLAPGIKVYAGQIIGEHNRDNDLVVSIGKGKKLTNMRASGSDENIILTPPRRFSLEQAIDYINDDELVEITPQSIRLRKKFLNENERKRQNKLIKV